MLKIYGHLPGRPAEQLPGMVHFNLLAALKSGLSDLDIPYEYQPDELPQDGDLVLVASDQEWLRELINYKRSGPDFTLLAGPIMEMEHTHREGEASLIEKMPSEFDPMFLLSQLDSVFTDKEVDGVLCAGYWAKAGWRFMCPDISHKIHEWRAGVDINYWDGNCQPEKKRVLLYEKRDPELMEAVQLFLEGAGYQVDVFSYGNYQLGEFREGLRQCEMAIVLSSKETQGIALAEMWAMDVPTLCWDSFSADFIGVPFPTSSCPYLTAQTGWRWRDVQDLEQVLEKYQRSYFSPRSWVEGNMSHTISAQLLLELFDYIEFRRSRGINLPT